MGVYGIDWLKSKVQREAVVFLLSSAARNPGVITSLFKIHCDLVQRQ